MIAGHAYAWSGQWQDAAAEYRLAVSLAPDDPKARVALAMCLANLGDHTGALEQLEAASRVQPDNHLLLAKRVELLLSLNRPAEAADMLVELGDRMKALGRDSEALKHWRHAVTLAPGNEKAHVRLLTAYRQSGDLDAATREQHAVNDLRRDAVEPALETAGGADKTPAETPPAEPDFTAEEVIAFVERTLAEQARTLRPSEPEQPAEVEKREEKLEPGVEDEAGAVLEVPAEQVAEEEPAVEDEMVLAPEETTADAEPATVEEPAAEVEVAEEAAPVEPEDEVVSEPEIVEVEPGAIAEEQPATGVAASDVLEVAPPAEETSAVTDEAAEATVTQSEASEADTQTGAVAAADEGVETEPAPVEKAEPAVVQETALPVEAERIQASLTAEQATPAEPTAVEAPVEQESAGESEPSSEPAVAQATQVEALEQAAPATPELPQPPQAVAPEAALGKPVEKAARPWWRAALQAIGLSPTPAFERPPEGIDEDTAAAELESAVAEPAAEEARQDVLASEDEPEQEVTVAASDAELGTMPAEEAVEEAETTVPATEQVATDAATAPSETVAEEQAAEVAPAPELVDDVWHAIDTALSERRFVAAFDLQEQAVREVLAGREEEIQKALLSVPGVDEGTARELLALPQEQREPALLALTRAESLRRHGLYATAREECELAIALAPEFLPLQISLARTYEAMGRRQAAQEKYLCIADVYEIRGQEAEAGRIRELARAAA